MLQDLGRFEEALADLQQAIALDPDNATYLGHRGVCLRSLGAFSEGMADFEKVLAAVPTDVNALANRGCVLGLPVSTCIGDAGYSVICSGGACCIRSSRTWKLLQLGTSSCWLCMGMDLYDL